EVGVNGPRPLRPLRTTRPPVLLRCCHDTPPRLRSDQRFPLLRAMHQSSQPRTPSAITQRGRKPSRFHPETDPNPKSHNEKRTTRTHRPPHRRRPTPTVYTASVAARLNPHPDQTAS